MLFGTVARRDARLKPTGMYSRRVPQSMTALPLDRDTRFADEETEEPETVEGSFSIIGDIGIFVRGDANMDLEVDISDPIRVLLYLFGPGDPLPCPDAADANEDLKLDISDPIVMLDYLFRGEQDFQPYEQIVTGGTAAGLGCTF